MTNEAVTHLTLNSSSNASPAGGLKEFFVYVVIWPHAPAGRRRGGLIKAGYTAHESRWRGFISHRSGIPFSMTAFPTEKLARAYESTWLALLDFITYPAFGSREEAQQDFGKSNGWTEIYQLPTDLKQLAGFVPAAFGGTPFWGPDRAFGIMHDRAHDAYLEARLAFGDALRSKRYRSAVSA